MLLSGSLRLLSLAECQGAFIGSQGALIGGQGAFIGQGALFGGQGVRNLASGSQLPKKPSTPWINYYSSSYPAVRKARPDLKTTGAIMKQISADWKLVPDSQRASLTSSYLASKARWQKEMAAVPLEDKEAALQEKRAKRAAKLSRSGEIELSTLLSSLGKPTQPLSSFFIYLGERRPAMRGSYRQNLRQLGQEWGGMAAREKEVYSKKALDMRAEYEKEKVKWTKRMEKQGKMAAIQEAEEKVAAHKRLARGGKGEAGEGAEVELRNLLSHLGRPSRPASAYLLYCGDRRKGLPGTQGKDVRAEWKEMSEAKREVYTKQSAELKAAYDSDMKKWTLRMEKRGKMPSILEAQERVAALKKENKNKES